MIRVLLWDVRYGGQRRLQLIERVDADLVLLLGVSIKSGRAWAHRWAGRYHVTAGLDMTTSPQKRPHGALIAAKWPLQGARLIDDLTPPERGLIATVDRPEGPFTAISWGAPNAAGYGRPLKEDNYRRMTAFLTKQEGSVILGVDTNVWADPPLPTVEVAPPDDPYRHQHEFIRRDAPHGLVDVHQALVDADPHRSRLLAEIRPHGPLAVTFIRRPHRTPRGLAGSFEGGVAYGLDRMDRIYVSKDITPRACEHLYHEAIAAGGDHAAVVADIEL